MSHEDTMLGQRAHNPQEDKAQYNLAVEKMKTAYPNLLQGGREVVEKNIRKLLKESFPDTKFSVKKESYNSTRVNWEDGPTTDQVNEIAKRFQDGHFDSMTDCQSYTNTPFSDVYGNVTSVFSSRSLSDDRVAEAIETINTDYGKFLDENSIPRPTVEKYNSGGLMNIAYNSNGDSLFDLVRTQLNEMDKIQNEESGKMLAR